MGPALHIVTSARYACGFAPCAHEAHDRAGGEGVDRRAGAGRTRRLPQMRPDGVEPSNPTPVMSKAGRVRPRAKMTVSAELRLPSALVQLVRLNHGGPSRNTFRRDDVFWMDACVTPRRPNEHARYVDRWGPHRTAALGSVILLPPGETLDLTSAGGRRTSLICQLRADVVRRCLPADFEFTDRRLEASRHLEHHHSNPAAPAGPGNPSPRPDER